MDGYETLKFFHILMAIVWVGGAIYAQILATRALASGSPGKLADTIEDVAWIGPRIFTPASFILVVVGFVMLADDKYPWEVGDTWIVLALIGFAATFLTGTLFFGPESGRIAKLSEERGREDPQVQERIARFLRATRIDLVVLILVVLDMVAKPGL